MTQGFYKDSIVLLESAIEEITSKLNIIRKYKKVKDGRDPIEYVTTRVKSEESLIGFIEMTNLEIKKKKDMA